MLEEKQRNIMKVAAIVLVLLVGTIALVSVYNSKNICPLAPPNTGTEAAGQNNPPAAKTAEPNNVQGQPAEPEIKRNSHLMDIVRVRQTWNPIFTSWYGENAPDFTATDITGKEHKLSDYRGKNVMLIFWATWCGPCMSEVPDLIMLRNMVGQDKLAMLALSNEPAERLRPVVARRQINYTVLSSNTFSMARPYKEVNGIPTCFFINPQGKIKIVSEGAVHFDEIRAILESE